MVRRILLRHLADGKLENFPSDTDSGSGTVQT